MVYRETSEWQKLKKNYINHFECIIWVRTGIRGVFNVCMYKSFFLFRVLHYIQCCLLWLCFTHTTNRSRVQFVFVVLLSSFDIHSVRYESINGNVRLTEKKDISLFHGVEILLVSEWVCVQFDTVIGHNYLMRRQDQTLFDIFKCMRLFLSIFIFLFSKNENIKSLNRYKQ